MTQRDVLPIASIPCGGSNWPIELPHLETFPGAACWQPIELPGYKAAPLQAFDPLNTRRVLQPFCVPLSSFKRFGVSELLVVALVLELAVTDACSAWNRRVCCPLTQARYHGTISL
jgi:hypothetical protein